MQVEAPLCGIVERLIRDGHGRLITVRVVRSGQILYAGDTDNEGDLVIVLKGRLRCFLSFEGKELTFHTLETGDAIQLHGGTMLEAKRDGEIALTTMSSFRQLVLAEPELALTVMPAIDRILQRSIRMIEDMAFHGVKHRFIRALCDTAVRDGRPGKDGIVIDDLPNAEDFAMQIGATRQSVSTIIAELVRSGILYRFGNGSMVISDLGRLRQELSGMRGTGA